MPKKIDGYGVWTDLSTGKAQEADTVQCKHCQNHIFVKPNTMSTVYRIWNLHTRQWTDEPGAWCRNCNGPVCLPCHEHGICNPTTRQLDIADLEVAMRDIRAKLG